MIVQWAIIICSLNFYRAASELYWYIVKLELNLKTSESAEGFLIIFDYGFLEIQTSKEKCEPTHEYKTREIWPEQTQKSERFS